jgi:hypothetical protein
MRLLSPFTHELSNLGLQVLFRFNISGAQALALADAEPLLHVIHPCTVNRGDVHDKAGMLLSPLADVFALRRPAMIAAAMNRLDVGGHFHIPLRKGGDQLLLPLAGVALPTDLS